MKLVVSVVAMLACLAGVVLGCHAATVAWDTAQQVSPGAFDLGLDYTQRAMYFNAMRAMSHALAILGLLSLAGFAAAAHEFASEVLRLLGRGT